MERPHLAMSNYFIDIRKFTVVSAPYSFTEIAIHTLQIEKLKNKLGNYVENFTTFLYLHLHIIIMSVAGFAERATSLKRQ